MNEYQAQAKAFLDSTGTTLHKKQGRVLRQADVWGSSTNDLQTIKFTVILRRQGKKVSFPYYCSHKDCLAIIAGDTADFESNFAYSFLACLSTVDCANFEEFCANYGYDTDSRKAYSTWREVQEQNDKLARLFTIAELEQLSEIV
jgi:hypothetical protein